MDPETLEIDGHISQHSIHHLDHFSNKQPADAIILKTDQLQPTQKQQQQQQTMVMEIDANNIKHEQSMIITPEIVTMMTSSHMGNNVT